MLSGDLFPVGEFRLDGSVLRVSDPCYERDVWCCGVIPDCLVGVWEAAVLQVDAGNWGTRNAALIVRHSKTGPKFTAINRALCNGTGQWHECEFEVGVDSGQAGFFDEMFYMDASVFGDAKPQFKCDGDRWYEFCCDATLNTKLNADVIPCGVVSTAGFGDGGYTCYYHKNSDDVVDFAFILFIDEEEL